MANVIKYHIQIKSSPLSIIKECAPSFFRKQIASAFKDYCIYGRFCTQFLRRLQGIECTYFEECIIRHILQRTTGESRKTTDVGIIDRARLSALSY